jgi:hypothetical protein
MNTNDILIIAKKIILNLTNLRIELYPAEGPMLKAPVAPFALVIIMCCLNSRTTWCRKMFAVSSLECPPRRRRFEEEDEDNVGSHQEEDDDDLKKRAVTETLPKNLIARTLEQMSLDGRRFWRPTLPTICARRWLGQEWQRAAQQQCGGVLGYVFFLANKRSSPPFM